MNLTPEMQNRRLDPMGLAKHGENIRLMGRVRVWPAQSQSIGLWDASGTEPTRCCGLNPDCWRVTRTRC
jgi:hypothetical protein